MSNTVYSDLSGIFYIQQQYLLDLSAISKDANAASLGYMQSLRTDLNDIYALYKTASPSVNATLSKQLDMNSIIDKEVTRLETKKTSVDSAIYGQKRMAQFSDSYSKKYFAQIKILFVVIIVLLIYLGLTMLNDFIPVPSDVIMIIMLVVGTFALFVILFTLKDIYSRYNMDFDKLNLRAPSSMEISGDLNGNINAGRLGGIFCIGESCCPANNANGTIWDSNNQQCVSLNISGTSKSGFTVMSQESKGEVSPYEPSEINSYTKI
jgi:hypothetical protein